jgi:site-specific DNA recombinase
MKAIGYVRVSTTDQANNGVSLEAQRERIEAWAKANGADLLAVHVDAGLSGRRADNRPALQTALSQACREKAALVVYSLSRLSRSIRDTVTIGERLTKAGATLVSLTEQIDGTTASGRLMLHLMTVLSQFERELIGERTRTAMAHLRGQNRRISGRVPYGFALDPDGETLVPLSAEQKAIRLMQTLRHQGASLRGIAAHLEKRGIRPKNGRTWTAATIAGILRRSAKLTMTP